MTETYPLARWSELAVCFVPATEGNMGRLVQSGVWGSMSRPLNKDSGLDMPSA